MTTPEDQVSSYEDKQVTDEGMDRLAQGHGDAPDDEHGITGGAKADADPNPAFHGGDMASGTDPAAAMPAHEAFEDGLGDTVTQ